MNYMQLNTCDSMNGPGNRVSLFVAGCELNCPGCFNPESHSFTAGSYFSTQTMNAIIQALDDPHIQGLSILGGDPCHVRNIDHVLEIVRVVRGFYGDTKDIWVWSGYKRSAIARRLDGQRLLDLIDVLVDGPFIQEKKGDFQYRGSSNQRVIPLYLERKNPPA